MTTTTKSSLTVDRRQLAKVLGVSLRQITELEAAGIVVPSSRGRGGRPSVYALEAVVPRYVQHLTSAPSAGAEREARRRRDEAQARLLEQTHCARERELLPRHEVDKLWSAEVAAVRAHLLAWTDGITDQVHRASALEGVAGVQRVIEKEIRIVLTELSTGAHAQKGQQ